VLYSNRSITAAEKLKKEMTQEFPGLSVTMEESESLRLKDPE
jgi:hypothetical protein